MFRVTLRCGSPLWKCRGGAGCRAGPLCSPRQALARAVGHPQRRGPQWGRRSSQVLRGTLPSPLQPPGQGILCTPTAPAKGTVPMGVQGPRGCTHPREAGDGQRGQWTGAAAHLKTGAWPSPAGREERGLGSSRDPCVGSGGRAALQPHTEPQQRSQHSGSGADTHLRGHTDLLVQAVAVEGVRGPSEHCKE